MPPFFWDTIHQPGSFAASSSRQPEMAGDTFINNI